MAHFSALWPESRAVLVATGRLHSFVHSFNEQLMSSDSVPGTQIVAENKRDTPLPFPSLKEMGVRKRMWA